jgi:glycerol-3-phosphate acyltransferase PlsX
MRIAVDAMGGDFAPLEIVAGAIQAADRLPLVTQILLVGQKDLIEAELSKYARVPSKIQVYHASETVEMGETPAQAVRRKKDSSINRCADLVKSGDADALMSAGNTGAVVVSSMFKLRLLEGVMRPAIATVLPTQSKPLVMLDAGANVDSDARMLAQFAAMGSVYSNVILGQSKPVVGVLSIGGEESKGNEITKEAFRILQGSHLNFRGNVEGHDLFRGETDVVVCDGFVGNVVLKTSESVSRAIGHWMKQEFRRTPLRMLGSLFLMGALKHMKVKMDPEMYGGAPLLGVNGVSIITHGSSSSKAIYHAIRVACESVTHHLNDSIISEVKKVDNIP